MEPLHVTGCPYKDTHSGGMRSAFGEMVKAVRSHLPRRQKQPTDIRNLFKEKHARYVA